MATPASTRARVAQGTFAWLMLLLCGLCVTGTAHADSTRLVVLSPATDDSDDTLATALGAALRDAVRSMDDFSLSDAHVSLDQLGMANDCDLGSPACLRRIAKGLSVDGLVYASISSKGGGSQLVEVKYFNAHATGSQTQKRSTYVFADPAPPQREIKEAVDGILAELFGRKAPPTVAPAAVAPEAAANAELEAEASPAPAEKAAHPEADYTDKPEHSGVTVRRVAGYTLLGVAAVSAGLTALSFVQIDRAQGNNSLYDYRTAVGQQNPMVRDVCTEAGNKRNYGLSPQRFSEVRDTCSMAGTYGVLQYVFLGAALLTGGASAYLLITDGSSNSDRAANAGRSSARLSLRPSVGFKSVGLNAHLRF